MVANNHKLSEVYAVIWKGMALIGSLGVTLLGGVALL